MIISLTQLNKILFSLSLKDKHSINITLKVLVQVEARASLILAT